jgi:hypothetical protein
MLLKKHSSSDKTYLHKKKYIYMWVNSEFVNKKQILQIGKKRKEADKFEEKLMFTVNFNLIHPVMN